MITCKGYLSNSSLVQVPLTIEMCTSEMWTPYYNCNKDTFGSPMQRCPECQYNSYVHTSAPLAIITSSSI